MSERVGNAIQDRYQFGGKRGGIPPFGPSAEPPIPAYV